MSTQKLEGKLIIQIKKPRVRESYYDIKNFDCKEATRNKGIWTITGECDGGNGHEAYTLKYNEKTTEWSIEVGAAYWESVADEGGPIEVTTNTNGREFSILFTGPILISRGAKHQNIREPSSLRLVRK